MFGLRLLLIVILIALTGYTGIVIANHGIGLLPVFFGDMAAVGWPGQFNLDFMCMLALSATWLAWRHDFTPLGFGLGVLGFFGGALFLSVYLLVVSFRCDGMKELLLGQRRAET